jgi:hypothetical protein
MVPELPVPAALLVLSWGASASRLPLIWISATKVIRTAWALILSTVIFAVIMSPKEVAGPQTMAQGSPPQSPHRKNWQLRRQLER